MKIEMHNHEKDDFWGYVDSVGSPCTYVCVCPNGLAEHVVDCGDNGPGWMTTRAAIGCMAMRSDRTRCKSDAIVDAPLCELHMDKAAKWFAFAHPTAFLRLLDDAEHHYARTLIRSNQADDLHAELAALKSRVYFLGIDDEIVKIGYSINPTNRAASIRQGSSICPDGYDRKRAKLLGSIPGGQSVEAQLHSVLRPHRIAGEWFHLHDDVRAVINFLLTGEDEALASQVFLDALSRPWWVSEGYASEAAAFTDEAITA